MSKWNLSVLFKNDEDWLKELETLPPLIEALKPFQGTLGTFESFKIFQEKNEALEKKIYRLYLYMHLQSDLNLKDIDKQSKLQKLMFILNQLGQATSFVSPEMIQIGEEKLISFIDRDPSLEAYRFPIQKLFFQQHHVLDNDQEKLLSNFSMVSSIPTQLYQSLAIIDAKDVDVTLSDGQTVRITPSNYRSWIPKVPTALDRKHVFEAVYQRYQNNKSAFANVYNLVLQNKRAYYLSRKFDSALEAALYGNNIPTSVFHNLKDVAYENTSIIKRYIALRKKYLNLETYHTYDRFLTLAKDDTMYPYEASKKLFFESIKHLDKAFIEKQHAAVEDGYVDVLPSDGKRTGAYSSGFYGHHPYILLNHDETLDSVFTLAHEAGHSAHTLFSNEAQPMAIADYTIFVAEIASTFNEHVLLDYLLSQAQTKEQKIVLIEKAIDGIMGTFFRQTLFATYEFIASEKVRNGEPINDQVLSQIMIDLYKHYYDLDITTENGKELVWAYIPHLYSTPFYVYQYATSYSASLKIFDNVKSNKKDAMKNYMNMLKLGGSMYPVDEAKVAGADLTDKETFMAVIKHFTSLVDQLEKALNE